MHARALLLRLPLRVVALFVFLAALAPPASAVTIDWVSVGDPGNACDTQPQGCFGEVNYSYVIAKHAVTNAQYTEFLNTVDATGANSLGLYNPLMEHDPAAETVFFGAQHGGITFDAGAADGSKYAVKSGFDDKPVVYVSFFDALRFTNWLYNDQGSGSTETGAYTLLGGTAIPTNWDTVTRNPEATIFLPTEDEWYKAAYYDALSTSYFDFPAGSDTQIVCDTPGSTPNTANCNGALNIGTLTDVGAYTGSASPYGTFDQGGNTWEWNEVPIVDGGPFGVPAERILRGGGFGEPALFLGAGTRLNFDPGTGEFWDVGFRLAGTTGLPGVGVPEPGTIFLLGGGLLALAVRQRRRS
jgi:formylglycine-generating enzyme